MAKSDGAEFKKEYSQVPMRPRKKYFFFFF